MPASSPTATPTPTPRLAIIGGRLEPSNAALYGAMRDLCRGRIAVLATASNIPDQVSAETVTDFARYGVAAEVLPLTWENHATAAFDQRLVDRLTDIGSVYFTGGDQSHLIGALCQGGVDTPMLAAIRAIGDRGGLIAGSSAGAAVMSRHSILGGTSLEAIVHGVAADRDAPGLLLGEGFGFFTHGLVDQHFIQRGRIGRLLVAMCARKVDFAFGVDENTGLIVDGIRCSVVGEKGVLLLDARGASFDIGKRHYDNFRVSYLDDGDGYDLATHRALPAATRKPIRKSRAFVGPGYVQRSVFGPNAFDELITRLAEGDPERYARDQAVAYEPDAKLEVAVELERPSDRNASLAARRGRAKRFTMLGYGLAVRARTVAPMSHKEAQVRRTKQLMRGRKVSPKAKLVAIGAAVTSANRELLDALRGLEREVTVIASAAAAPRDVAAEYVALLGNHGIFARAYNDKQDDALERLAEAPAILLAGGNQDRLLQALFQQGEESALLEATLASYRRGGCLIAIGGSANALSPAMISGGSSEEALCYGASPDAWYRGVVLQEGLGIFRAGLIDQHFLDRNRLGRLLVACIEEGMRFGFGLAGDSGLVATGGGHKVQAVGRSGFACVDLNDAVLQVHEHGFDTENVRVRWVAPGQAIDTGTGALVAGDTRRALRAGGHAATEDDLADAADYLAEVVERFADEAKGLRVNGGNALCTIDNLRFDGALAQFSLKVERPTEGRRSMPELDFRGRPRRD